MSQFSVTRAIWSLGFALGACSWALAQTPPDAGQLRQQMESSLPKLVPGVRPEAKEAAPPPAMNPTGEQVTVNRFQFAGNSLLSHDQLLAVVAPWLNRPLNFTQLQEAAAAVGQAYRDAGWVVRTYLPRQEITQGLVTIQIIEARFGDVLIESENSRRLGGMGLPRNMVLQNQTPGEPLNGAALDRSLLLLSDLPGVEITGNLTAGKQQAQSDVVLKIIDKPLISGSAGADNAGSRSTGKARLTANLALNSPLGLADQSQLSLAHTQGSDYVGLGYSLPVGYKGWRATANASHMKYQLVGADFAALGASGDSNTWGAEVTYPLVRSRQNNLNFNTRWDRKTFNNLSGGKVSTQYALSALNLSLSGNRKDNLGLGGTNQGSLTLVRGQVNLAGSPNQAADAATTQVDGSYGKLRYNFSRQQTLTPSLSLQASLSGQWASKNLDSSEKFYLGGSSGVRAYPSSEGGGSEGQMVNLELLWAMAGGLALSGFFDTGSVKVNRNNDFVGRAALNTYSLQGLGVAVGWTGQGGISAKGVLARRVGDNPNPAANGNDQDGTLVKNRLWFQSSLPF